MNKRLRINVSGTIQGVGFRPFVFKLACQNNLTGHVQNTASGVQIEIQSNLLSDLDAFCHSLIEELPPLAKIDHLQKLEIEPLLNEEQFSILNSSSSEKNSDGFGVIPPPDSATCTDCLHELFSKADRRFRYPFINCTNCGPRFTIINELPYDRCKTSMESFRLCSACNAEYKDPTNRRFHAQPNACFDCGPRLSFQPANIFGEMALKTTVDYLKQGKIVAVKGLGGFQLLCDATDEKAIARLRVNKHRPAKPFAIMVANLTEAAKYCVLDQTSQHLLSGITRPIVLLLKKHNSELAPNLSYDLDKQGVMLPYTPLHYLLLSDFDGPLVATSGNTSEEPIAYKNDEAINQLSHIADAFLMNDREITSRYDDSVSTVFNQKEISIRRARGQAPTLVNLSFGIDKNILALGGHLKNTFCLGRGKQALLSQHLGDLDNAKGNDNFREALSLFQKLFSFRPELLARDLHPDYTSSFIAEELSKELSIDVITIQHHHAHIAACMSEHNLTGPVIGVAFDGLALGADETLWGGEFLLCKYDSFIRLAHFKQIAMPGGSVAIKEPWRMTLAIINKLKPEDQFTFEPFLNKLSHHQGQNKIDLIAKQIENSFNAPLTSSCGRLFDAVAALIEICPEQKYEGQAPAELEALARSYSLANESMYTVETQMNAGVIELNPELVFIEIQKEMNKGISKACIALKFHHAIKNSIVETCRKLKIQTACSTVCLSGGVFQNQLLLQLTQEELIKEGFSVYHPQRIPCNDGGLSLGQLAVAAHSR